MKRRIFTRVFLGYAIVSFLAVLVFAFYTLRLARDISFDTLTRGLESAALTAKVPITPLLPRGRSSELDALVAGIGREGRVRVTVIDRKGVVLADSQDDPAGMENHSERPEVAVALRGATGMSSRFSGTVRRWMIYVAVPVLASDGAVAGVVRASTYAEELSS